MKPVDKSEDYGPPTEEELEQWQWEDDVAAYAQFAIIAIATLTLAWLCYNMAIWAGLIGDFR